MTVRQKDARPVALVARELRKSYRLGELHSLRQTIQRVVHRSSANMNAPLEVLAGVDFTVYRGESIGIVGTNGSGKSTMLQILAGTTLPTGGEIEVHGLVVPLLAVGTGFHADLTGRENVTLFASSLGVPRDVIEGRIDAVACFAALELHMDTPVKRFSSGMVSRLSFAIAMQCPADVYVFDEVLAVVDGEFQGQCLREITRLHKEGRTIIFVSHSLDQIAEVCDRVMWMEQGRIEMIGPTTEVLAAYEDVHGARER